jgi:DNA-binding response OmpR family regulator/HPt (histidine-containing phosphotransfer) domain-containing protein
MKVLIAENNPQMLKQLCDILDHEGYSIFSAPSGTEALKVYSNHSPDFICLDIMMPDLNGYDVCKEIRKTDAKTPIIFISSKSKTVDKVIGLEVGADDYIIKPFDTPEVIARIRAITRRCIVSRETVSKDAGDNAFWLKDLKVMPSELRAEKNGKSIELSLRDIKVLRLFHDNKGKAFDRDTLLDRCWGTNVMPESRIVDWHISQLRRKIETDPAHPQYIKTIHRVGYKFEDDRPDKAVNDKLKDLQSVLGPDYIDDHIQSCLNEISFLMQKIFEDHEKENYEPLQLAAHDLKSVAGAAGMMKMHALSNSIEHACMDKKFASLTGFIKQLNATLQVEKADLKVV